MKSYYRYFLQYPGFIRFPYIKKQINFNFQVSAALVEPSCHFIQTRYCIATACPYYTAATFTTKMKQ
jgi:hypothetical protein